MSNEEILKMMFETPINLMFREPKNNRLFIEFIREKKLLWSPSSFNDLLGKRHITFFYADHTKSPTCMYGDRSSLSKKDIYYEDLFSQYAVELI